MTVAEIEQEVYDTESIMLELNKIIVTDLVWHFYKDPNHRKYLIELDTQQKIFSQICKREGLPIPKTEYHFHPTRRWRIDYYFEQNGRKVALEVEGGVYNYGRHNRASGFVKDMEKYNALAVHGILLYRVLPRQLLTIKTIENLKKILIA